MTNRERYSFSQISLAIISLNELGYNIEHKVKAVHNNSMIRKPLLYHTQHSTLRESMVSPLSKSFVIFFPLVAKEQQLAAWLAFASGRGTSCR